MLRCVYCGFCVDACPKDAIWMTRDYEMAFFNREEAVFGINKLVAKPGLPVKDGLGYRPYYPGDGTVPPTDAAAAPVPPGDGERFRLREEGLFVVPRPSAPQLEAEAETTPPASGAAKAVGVLLLAATLLAACASREKGRLVSVTRMREQVTPCAFLGRVTSHDLGETETAEATHSSAGEFAMKRAAASLGADTLLLLPGGLSGEAYRCGSRLVLDGPSRLRPTAMRIPVAATPTPSGVWPAGSR